MNAVVLIWRESLRNLLYWYESSRGKLASFYPLLFLFFVFINMACYWLAMFTAFPELTHGAVGDHYFLVSFPVGFLGALFDSLSFFVTIHIIRRALEARGSAEYVAHLSLDLLIAVVATFWVVFVFSFSGWIIHTIEANHQVFTERQGRYNTMLTDAIASPTDNLRNIYFGIVMGMSAGLPTLIHVALFLRSVSRALSGQFVRT
jgi:hypothetical protein